MSVEGRSLNSKRLRSTNCMKVPEEFVMFIEKHVFVKKEFLQMGKTWFRHSKSELKRPLME